ncbi:MAG: sulfatase-like hydrolase/transferase, partial [Gammaproteobacteria bacterium]|nr:sulfatase-like hydrolase/transferase [Gammaproteobacteria bacterium]
MEDHQRLIAASLALLLILVGCGAGQQQDGEQDQQQVSSTEEELDRTVLPIPDPVFPKITELDARNATAPPPFSVTAPDGAPNVVIVLIDDIGFGASAVFGGAIRTPTLDRLAQNGLRYNQFHTPALCSPTRMAILTGRNHHSANAGSVM